MAEWLDRTSWQAAQGPVFFVTSFVICCKAPKIRISQCPYVHLYIYFTFLKCYICKVDLLLVLILKRQMYTKTSDYSIANRTYTDQFYIPVFLRILMCNVVAPLQKIQFLQCSFRTLISQQHVSVLVKNLLRCQRLRAGTQNCHSGLCIERHAIFFCLSKSELARNLIC